VTLNRIVKDRLAQTFTTVL